MCKQKLTVLDLFVLIFTCSLAAFFLCSLNLTYSDGLDIGYAAIVLLAGPALAGPAVLVIRFVRGHQGMLLPGELAWCGTAVALSLCVAGLWTQPHTLAWFLYSAWFFVLWPLSAILLACYSIAQHIRLRCGRRWSHMLGIGLSLTQLVLVVALALII